MKKAGAVVLLAASVAVAAPAVVTDDDSHWQLDVPDGWTPADLPEITEGKALAAWSSNHGRLVIVRMRGNTDAAYDGKAAYFAGLEEGVQKEAPGYHRLAATQRKLGKKKKIPAYDLWYRAAAGVRGIRFIFMKNYSVLATVDVPGATKIGPEAKKILESFGPAPPATP
jgi:hypothetical protein